jgi:hypothetical protein
VRNPAELDHLHLPGDLIVIHDIVASERGACLRDNLRFRNSILAPTKSETPDRKCE